MNITISMKSNLPLYEQIKTQIIKQIIKKDINIFDKLPSIRSLAKTLRVGIITVKRAYDDLVNEGYLISKEAKGYFVNDISLNELKNEADKEIKEKLKKIKIEADLYNIDYQRIKKLLEDVYHG